MATHTRLSVEKVGELLEKAAGPRAQEAIVTVLDEIERRGVRKGLSQGLSQGRTQGRAQALLDLLAARFGAVTPDVSARIMSADEAAIARWTVRILTAPTLAEVLSKGGEKVSPATPPPARKRARRP